MNKVLSKIWGKIQGVGINDSHVEAENSRNVDMATPKSVDMSSKSNTSACPKCASADFVKRGIKRKKLENVQIYLCKNCGKTFVEPDQKGKHYPMRLVIEGMSYYNLGFGLKETCQLLNQKFGVNPGASTLGGWVTQYSGLCRYARLRPYAAKMCKPSETVEVTTMAHRQIFRFRYHRPKMALALQEFKNRHLEPLKDYLDAVSAETPHQYFQDGLRISEIKTKFDKAQMIIKSKHNYANELARFALQAVKENKQRHEELQRFMIANDSVTVATEVPVYIRREDVEHLENQLNFKILEREDIDRPRAEVEPALGTKPRKPKGDAKAGYLIVKGKKEKVLPRLLTGHIDIVQVRNGMCHLLDYKPDAAKEKPIEQLTWYALALSRLTGLRLYEFKCGWFDENDYFEFYPLHVVKKISNRKRKKIYFKSGTSVEIPEENKVVVA